MIGIQAIGRYIPEGRIDNRQRMTAFEVDEAFLNDKTGMVRVAIKAEDEETSDLCCRAFADLQAKTAIRNEDIDCIVVCTQNPDRQGLPHTSAIVHAKLGLADSCAAFDISLGCSGFVYGLSIIQSFMQVNGFKRGILFTADPYSAIVDPQDKNTSLLFGDAATATLMSHSPIWHIGKCAFGSQGSASSSIQVDGDSRRLTMNGRAVFSFSATVVPKNINQMLSNNQLSVDDVDVFVLHQGSKYIVDTIRSKLGIAASKVPFMASDYGNTVSSSIPLILGDPALPSSRNIVIAGFGVGLSWASTVLFAAP